MVPSSEALVSIGLLERHLLAVAIENLVESGAVQVHSVPREHPCDGSYRSQGHTGIPHVRAIHCSYVHNPVAGSGTASRERLLRRSTAPAAIYMSWWFCGYSTNGLFRSIVSSFPPT